MHFNDIMKDLYYSSDEDKPVRGRPKGKKTRLSKDEQRARNAELEARRRQREKKGYMALAISLGFDPNSVTRDEILATALCLIKDSHQPLSELKKRNKQLKHEVRECKRRLASQSEVVEPPPKGLKIKSEDSPVAVKEDPAGALYQRLPLKGIDAATSTALATPTGSNSFSAQASPEVHCNNCENLVLENETLSPPTVIEHNLESLEHGTPKLEVPIPQTAVSYSLRVAPTGVPPLGPPPLTNVYNPHTLTHQLKCEKYSPISETGISSDYVSYGDTQLAEPNYCASNLDHLIKTAAVVINSPAGLVSSQPSLISSPVDNSSSDCWYDSHEQYVVPNEVDIPERAVEEIIAEIPPSISDSIMNELATCYLNTLQ